MNKKYWKTYYRTVNQKEHSSFAKFCLSYMNIGDSIVDVGCGCGRDSLYFAKNKMKTLGIDRCKEAIDKCEESDNLTFLFKDLLFITDYIPAQNYYLRFILHSLPIQLQFKVLYWVTHNLVQNGLLFIETRSDKDENVFLSDHARCFTNKQKLNKFISDLDLDVIFLQESRGLSKTLNEDPVLIRLIGRKKV